MLRGVTKKKKRKKERNQHCCECVPVFLLIVSRKRLRIALDPSALGLSDNIDVQIVRYK